MSDSDSDDERDCELRKIVDDGAFNNYGAWSIVSRIQLLVWDMWRYIDGPESTPPVVPPLRETATISGIDDSGCMATIQVPGNEDEHQQKMEDHERWMVGNSRTLCKIFNAIPDAQFFLVMHTDFAKGAWESLRSYYEPRNTYQAERIINDIKTYRCTRNMDVAQWLNDMYRLYDSVCALGSKGLFSDRDFTLAVLDNMPIEDSAWRPLILGLRRRVKEYDSHRPSPILISSHEFISDIREEIRFSRDDLQTPEKKAQKRHRRAPDAASTSNRTKRRRIRFCTNPHCGVPKGHNFADCVAYGGGSQGKYGPGWKGMWNIHLPAEQRTKANNVPPRWHPAHAEITTAPELLTCIVD